MTLAFTDHHIQDKIISRLVQGECRFTELVPEGMEHSLFMYHMRKLLKAGLVGKDDQTYCLTLRGAQLYNARYHLGKPLNYPRALIQFLVVNDDRVLLSRRTTAIADKLNEYMLPGGLHFFLAPSRTAAKQIARSRGLVAGEYIGLLETIAPAKSYHGLIDLYAATFDHEVKRTENEFSHEWLPLSDVVTMSFDQAGSAPFIVQHYLDKDLTPRMTHVVTHPSNPPEPPHTK